MAVLSNNGRLIVSLPVATSLQSTDQFIIQSVSNINPNGVTKRATYGFLLSDLNSLILTNIQNTPTLKLTGSFYNPDLNVANFYTTIVRNGLTVTNGGITVSAGASVFQSLSSTALSGPLTGNVLGNITSGGTSTFNIANVSTLNVSSQIQGDINSTGASSFTFVDITGGTIEDTAIGQSIPDLVTGTKITGSIGLKSLGNLFVDGYTKLSGITYATIISGSRITGSKGITGSLKGNFTGDIFSPTGVKVLENGTGISKKALFYGTSSYASSSFRSLTASYALKSISINKTTFALSSSYASSSRFSISSSYASSSFKSRFSFSSSYASSSKFSISSSYASSSISSSYTFRSKFTLSSSYASSSKKSLTSSYILQSTNRTKSIPVYNGTALVGASQLNYYPYGNSLFLKLSGSYNDISTFSNTAFTIESPSLLGGGYSSQFVLSTDLNRKGRSFYSTFGDDYLAGGGPEGWLLRTFDSGSFGLQSWWESYNFNNQNYVTKLNNSSKASSTFSFAKIINNDIYFWGEPYSYNSSMRDGAMGIGIVQPSNQTVTRTTKARLHINVFSSSASDLGKGAWVGDGTVRNLPAILVTYGSGSVASPFTKTFYVSGSGKTYIGNTLSSSQDVYVGGDLHVTGELKGVAADGFAKAWVNFGFDGTKVVISGSGYNVATVVRNGTQGDYTITFSSPSPFSNTNYLMIGTATIGNGSYPAAAGIAYKMSSNTTLTQKTTSAVRIIIFDNSQDAPLDPVQANVVFFGN